MKILYLFIFFIFYSVLSAQGQVSPETLRNTQRNICAIKIINHASGQDKVIAVGCGVVLMSPVQDRNEYFVATVLHILEPLFNREQISATINLFDKNGNIYKCEEITKSHIIWANKSMDAALVVLSRNLQPVSDLPGGYDFPGLANLKLIGNPDWGEEIYLFGYRWIDEHNFIDVVKKGILSVGTEYLPGYEGNLVYLIDNMANKGMSGGLAFTREGTSIGVISSYVYESGNNLMNSDDLTVCLPLTIYFGVLGSIITSSPEKIVELIYRK
jgi:hypothetical protein